MEPSEEFTDPSNTEIRSFGWEDVTINGRKKRSKPSRRILSDVSGYLNSGEMLAILGPS